MSDNNHEGNEPQDSPEGDEVEPTPGEQARAAALAAAANVGAEPATAAPVLTKVEGDTVLPHHEPRLTDIDPKAARRAERQVAIMFGLAAVLILSFVVVFMKTPLDSVVELPFLGPVSTSNLLLGLTFGLGTFLIGAGAIHWARKLMANEEVAQERHPLSSTPEERSEAKLAVEEGANLSGLKNYPIIRRTLILAMAVFPIPLIWVLRDLGPMPGKKLDETMWESGERLITDISEKPIRPGDLPIGGLISAMPAALPEEQELSGNLNERAKSAIILVRMEPGEIVSQQGGTAEEPWDYQGILAFSKICTHVGCPIALYQQQTHHLICPCHQSTFDLSDSGNVVFGPAARELPQLPITIDAEGFLVARSGFAQPVGPSFWERS